MEREGKTKHEKWKQLDVKLYYGLTKEKLHEEIKEEKIVRWTWNPNTYLITLGGDTQFHKDMDPGAVESQTIGFIHKTYGITMYNIASDGALIFKRYNLTFDDIQKAIRHFLNS